MEKVVILLALGVFAISCSNDNNNTDDNTTDASTDTDSDPSTDTETEIDTDTLPDITGNEFCEENFTKHTVSYSVIGVAFVSAADLDDDGNEELIISSFGPRQNNPPRLLPGKVEIYKSDGTLDNWTSTEIVGDSDDIFFPSFTSPFDVDGDGDLDIVSPSGFFVCGIFNMSCGALAWLEQTDSGFERHDILKTGTQDGFYHHADLVDLDKDGLTDILAVSETRMFTGTGTEDSSIIHLYRGTTTGDLFEKTPVVLGKGLGSYPSTLDLDGDGDDDIASSEFFTELENVSFAWMEQVAKPSGDDPGEWTRHVIADDLGPAIQLLFIPNLFGDGKLYAVGSNHTNEPNDGFESAAYAFEVPEDPTISPWPRKKIASDFVVTNKGEGQAAPGVFGFGDIDGDGDIDIVISGDGDQRVFVLMQNDDHEFDVEVLARNMGQASGMLIVDLDNDGANELVVTSYDNNLVNLYEWTGN